MPTVANLNWHIQINIVIWPNITISVKICKLLNTYSGNEIEIGKIVVVVILNDILTQVFS